ncbi:hypothetical protein ACCS91_37770 [Rhizobium ruizarguesonis]
MSFDDLTPDKVTLVKADGTVSRKTSSVKLRQGQLKASHLLCEERIAVRRVFYSSLSVR